MSSSKRNVTSNSQEQQPVDVYMCGLSAAGKTTIVHVIKHGELVETVPTIGIDFQTVIIGTITVRAWEPGGRSAARVLRQMYYQNAKAFLFVVDSSDRDRIDEARQELHEIRNEDGFKHKPVLIFANKQDLPDAMPVDEIRDKLALSKFDKKINWHLQAASAIQNKGIKEGFEWLTNCFVTKTNVTKPIIETFNDSGVMKNDLLSVLNLKKLLNKFIRF